LEELRQILTDSYTMEECGLSPEIEYLTETADVGSWLDGHVNNFANITGAHLYMFELKSVDGEMKCVLSCKQYAACSDRKIKVVGPVLKVSFVRGA